MAITSEAAAEIAYDERHHKATAERLRMKDITKQPRRDCVCLTDLGLSAPRKLASGSSPLATAAISSTDWLKIVPKDNPKPSQAFVTEN